ncbi:hypothetical protein RJ639_001022 [Escallonia herrerae]|uniref:RING-type E3 ubiquitin transferase n=1 Tax=Escallonia herrerae TaxID=1293975 RepID=A0AA89BT63_9ASTE|nr:hypothetical protein RJ639_001022 [Escallonia herrerae]
MYRVPNLIHPVFGSVFTMAFFHRKLLLQLVQVARDVSCYKDCNSDDPSPPPPPPPTTISPILFLMFGVLGAAFLVVCYQIIVAKYRPSFLNSWARRRNPSSLDGTNDEDFVDENHAPLVNHPIWLINTIGLPQSVIDSIAVFKYNRGEGLNEGTECSVCLNEFQEDESLRLLPKCSHAFHILCIDTWLRSHTNCPLCRAPIVYDMNANLNTTEPNLSESDSRENIRGEILENQAGEDVNIESGVAVENSTALPSEEGKVVGFMAQNSSNLIARNHEARVLSDLANRREKMKDELQPVRRSISMDSSSASVIHFGVANMHPMEDEGFFWDSRQVKKLNTEKVRRSNGSHSRTCKVTKSSSFGPSDGSNSRTYKVTKNSS